MVNKEHLPDNLFDWLETSSFGELADKEKKEVLVSMSAEEYDDLRESVFAIRKAAPVKVKNRKEELLQRFDQKHRKPLRIPVYLWKLAAALLLLLAAGQFYYFTQLKNELASVQPHPADTVYLAEKPVVTEVRIHDTVYFPVVQERVRVSETNGRKIILPQETPVEPRMNILSVEDIESGPNKGKGNSLEQDSMMRRFSFVTM